MSYTSTRIPHRHASSPGAGSGKGDGTGKQSRFPQPSYSADKDGPPANNCMMCAYPSTMKCSSCDMAWYCGKDCQRMAWPKHKELCKILTAARESVPLPPRDSFCGLCGKSAKEQPMDQILCCGQTVCDDYDKYVTGSYSRKSCMRNHDRYTMCGQHGCMRGHDDVANWRDCSKCSGAASGDAQSRAWYMSNSYNFAYTPDERARAKDVPSVWAPTICVECRKPIKPNLMTAFGNQWGLQGIPEEVWSNPQTNRGLACSACTGPLGIGMTGGKEDFKKDVVKSFASEVKFGQKAS